MSKAHRFEMPTRTPAEHSFLDRLEETAKASQTTFVEKFSNAALWMPRQNLARLLAQWAIYQKARDVHGSIVECGVAFGGGLMAWANFVAIADPYCHTKRVIGFDTFSGFPPLAAEDAKSESGLAFEGGMAVSLEQEIRTLAALHDHNRPVGHVPRVEIVSGDANTTIPKFVDSNPHLLVSLLCLDFDLYQPTKTAIENFVPLMPRGAVIAFDEINCKDWPGESLAAREMGLLRLGRLVRSEHTSTMSYLVIE